MRRPFWQKSFAKQKLALVRVSSSSFCSWTRNCAPARAQVCDLVTSRVRLPPLPLRGRLSRAGSGFWRAPELQFWPARCCGCCNMSARRFWRLAREIIIINLFVARQPGATLPGRGSSGWRHSLPLPASLELQQFMLWLLISLRALQIRLGPTSSTPPRHTFAPARPTARRPWLASAYMCALSYIRAAKPRRATSLAAAWRGLYVGRPRGEPRLTRGKPPNTVHRPYRRCVGGRRSFVAELRREGLATRRTRPAAIDGGADRGLEPSRAGCHLQTMGPLLLLVLLPAVRLLMAEQTVGSGAARGS